MSKESPEQTHRKKEKEKGIFYTIFHFFLTSPVKRLAPIFIIPFLLLLLWPLYLYTHHMIVIDWSIFVTEYYIFLFNAILIIILSNYINFVISRVKEEITSTTNKNDLAFLLHKIQTNLEVNQEVDKIQIYWELAQSLIQKININKFILTTNFSKNSRFINSISSRNHSEKSSTPEYDDMKIFLNDLINFIEK